VTTSHLNPSNADRKTEYDAIVLEHTRRSCWNGTKVSARHRQRIHNNGLNFKGEWGRQLNRTIAMTNHDEGATVAIVGDPGSGKTQMAVEVMRQSIWKMTRPSAMFTDIGAMILTMRSPYQSRAGISELELFNSYTIPQFLVIDDADRRGESDWENNMLHAILNKRYGAMKSTILIANQSANVFCQAIGPAMVSRIKENGGIIECNANDFRARN